MLTHKHIAIMSVAVAVFTVAIAGASGSDGIAQATPFDWANDVLCEWTLCQESDIDTDNIEDDMEFILMPETGDRPRTQQDPTLAEPQCSNGVTFNCTAPKKPKTIHSNDVIENCTVSGVQGVWYYCEEAVMNVIDNY